MSGRRAWIIPGNRVYHLDRHCWRLHGRDDLVEIRLQRVEHPDERRAHPQLRPCWTCAARP
ncbi:hypothetical protein [Symbiobacterium thermophilum]|uniref:Uncharacterized protein n=1 Tax=Symbiobacterium thermophilum TaxID=2734 RepID=A0A953IG16_SYMTR|nr:hypothetical protein [Symbiobacterium thermophilum]MBY6277855.1 hypothetical protein [Symbiobacterium thermophilum]